MSRPGAMVFSTPLPAKLVRRRLEARDYLLALAAGAPAICRTTHVVADERQAYEEDVWRDIERMWAQE